MGTMLKLADMYKRVDKALGVALLPEIKTSEWKKGLAEIKKQLKAAS
jgi:hypothetical protein